MRQRRGKCQSPSPRRRASFARFSRVRSRGTNTVVEAGLCGTFVDFGNSPAGTYATSVRRRSMASDRVTFLFDVDNTLLDNDRIVADLMKYLEREMGHERQQRYWAIFEE